MTSHQALSQLEIGVLGTMYELYKSHGFPSVDDIFVVDRDRSPGGSFTNLRSEAHIDMPDGYQDMGGAIIHLPSLPYGLMAVVGIEGGRLTDLEITPYGNFEWTHDDGWRIE